MKILYFSQFYTPESIAPSFRAAENSKLWCEMGCDVTVFTGYPNYPKGRIFDGYIPKLMTRETSNGVKVIRSKLVAKPNTNTFRRLENALSYFLFGLINITFNFKKIGKNFDVVLGTSGIVFNALLAQIYAVFHKLPFVFEIRDISYVQLQATGKKDNSISVKGMKMLELFLCRKAKYVVVVTNGFKKTLVEDGISEDKIKVITNGVDVLPSEGVYDPQKNFTLSYFGTLGLSQNIMGTFEYGKFMSEFIDNFEYLIIGEGAQKEAIEKTAEEVSFIQILPGISSEELESYYCNTQLSIVTLKKSENFKYTIPSKLFQVMGRGIAVMFIGPDGETADIIRTYHAGLVLVGTVDENKEILKEFFSKEDWKGELKAMGKNGRKAVAQNYSRAKLAEKYLDILSSAMDRK